MFVFVSLLILVAVIAAVASIRAAVTDETRPVRTREDYDSRHPVP